MAVRWVCPNCSSGVNAPERPWKNDVRRYCLRCSEKSGILVERIAPSLERKRAMKVQLRTERATARREREKEAKLISLRDALGREQRVDAERLTRQALADMGFKRQVDVSVQRRGLEPRGHAEPTLWPRPHIHYSVPLSAGYERVLELIYHEAAHVVAGGQRTGGQRKRWHGPKFRRVLADGLQKRWPFLVYGSVNGGDGAYAADERIVEQLERAAKRGREL
jgi:hypothetical protein